MSENPGLERFLIAQDKCYENVLTELKVGKKESHWIWYIFPQLKGFGSSYNSVYYGISDANEAKRYYNHPILGSRLIVCSDLLLDIKGKSIRNIMGFPDDLKLKSSMTLFSIIPFVNPVFNNVLIKYYNGEKDQNTIKALNSI